MCTFTVYVPTTREDYEEQLLQIAAFASREGFTLRSLEVTKQVFNILSTEDRDFITISSPYGPFDVLRSKQ